MHHHSQAEEIAKDKIAKDKAVDDKAEAEQAGKDKEKATDDAWDTEEKLLRDKKQLYRIGSDGNEVEKSILPASTVSSDSEEQWAE